MGNFKINVRKAARGFVNSGGASTRGSNSGSTNSASANGDSTNIEGGVSTKGANNGFVNVGMAFVNFERGHFVRALQNVVMQMERKENLGFCQNGDV